MAEYPRLYRSGVQIKMVSRSNAEILNINRSSKRVYHKHTGNSTNDGGCYGQQTTHTHGPSCYSKTCKGHEQYSDKDWFCSLCGYRHGVGNPLGACGNPDCSGYGETGNNGYDGGDYIGTTYHNASNINSCDNYTATLICTKPQGTTYSLNCGYEV